MGVVTVRHRRPVVHIVGCEFGPWWPYVRHALHSFGSNLVRHRKLGLLVPGVAPEGDLSGRAIGPQQGRPPGPAASGDVLVEPLGVGQRCEVGAPRLGDAKQLDALGI